MSGTVQTITTLLAEFPDNTTQLVLPVHMRNALATLGAMAGSSDLAAYSAAGTTQGTATVLTTYNALVSTVNSGTGVKFPNVTGVFFNILNRGANSLNVYPPTGVAIETFSVNTPVSLGVGQNLQICINPITPTVAYIVSGVAAPGSTPAIVIPYGVATVTDGLFNTAMDGGSTNVFATTYRFQSPVSSNLNAVRIYFQGLNGTAGYGGGTGGIMRMIVCPDDGSANHLPVPGTVLFQGDMTRAIANAQPNSATGLFVTYTISPAVAMVAGTIYHLYFRDADANPAANFASVDMTYYSSAGPSSGAGGTSTMHPYANGGSYNNWAHLYQGSSGGSWTLRHGFTPTMQLAFSDGTVWGNAYIARGGTQRLIGPTIANQVRETITASTTRTVNGVRVAFTGSGTPTCRFETSGGTLIDQGTMADDAVYGSASGWGYKSFTFAAARTMTAGSSYHVTLTATSGSLALWTARKGSVSYAWDPKACFGDGWCEYSTNGTSTTAFGTVIDSGLAEFGPHETDMPLLFF